MVNVLIFGHKGFKSTAKLFQSRHFYLFIEFYILLITHDSVMTHNLHAQHKDHETEVAKWNSMIIHFMVHIYAFPALTCPNMLHFLHHVTFIIF